jgi:protein-L-isoaspartate O-methyltransferase
MSTQDTPQAGGDRETELAIVRRAYAKHVLANAEVEDARVEAAFAAVHREHFLGPGPWPMLRWPHRYVPTPSDDPVAGEDMTLFRERSREMHDLLHIVTGYGRDSLGEACLTAFSFA